MIGDNPREWESVLPLAEFAYNSSLNRSTQAAPFEVVYGYKLASVTELIPMPVPAKAHPKALDMVTHMQQVHSEVKERIEASNAK